LGETQGNTALQFVERKWHSLAVFLFRQNSGFIVATSSIFLHSFKEVLRYFDQHAGRSYSKECFPTSVFGITPLHAAYGAKRLSLESCEFYLIRELTAFQSSGDHRRRIKKYCICLYWKFYSHGKIQ